MKTDLVVLGSGPGGYSAAFRAADLGLSVVLVERSPVLGVADDAGVLGIDGASLL